MAETDDMRYRVEGQEERLTRYLSEKIEESDLRAKADEQLRPTAVGIEALGGQPAGPSDSRGNASGQRLDWSRLARVLKHKQRKE